MSYKDRKAVAKDLRPIHQAATDDAPTDALGAFAARWDDRYPMIAEQWRSAWERFTPFLAFPAEVRRIISTTDEIVKAFAGVDGVATGQRRPRRPVRRVRRVASLGRVAA